MTTLKICKLKQRIKPLLLTVLSFGLFFCLPQSSLAFDSRPAEVKLFDGTEVNSFLAFDEGYTGGGTLAAGDLGDDGVAEIVVGSGFNVAPYVKIFRQDGSLILEFLAYAPNFGRGITVALGDLDGDGVNEIITGTQYGGGPHVRVFDGYGNPKFGNGFFAYDENFRGGVNVTTGDIDGNGVDEIITGAGPTGGPHVRVFDGYGNLKNQFFAHDANETNGITVASADVNKNGKKEIIVGRQGIGPSTVKVFSITSPAEELISFDAFTESYQGGITVTGGDIDGDGYDEIGVTVNGNGGPHVRYFNQFGNEEKSLFAYESDYRGGVQVATANINNDITDEVITLANKKLFQINEPGKYIEVNLTEQHIYAYNDGILTNDFPVSTGTYYYATPSGEFSILEKLLWHDYSWYYGEGDPRNYDLPNVQYNLKFKPHYFIHYAYWHNNFGTPMSHGCVNVNLENSEWIYNWADLGTPVNIHY